MLKVYSPYDRSVIDSIPMVDEQAVEKALEKANNLYLDRSNLLAAHQRIDILEKVSRIMHERSESLIKIAAREGGKPYMDSKVEVVRAINGVKIAISYIGQLKGQQIPMGLTRASQSRIAFTKLEPIGVVASISAFNHPLNLIIHQTVTAIAAGCPVIVKPAKSTPLSCLAFADILKEAGLPDGWCQVMICGHQEAEKLASDKRVKYLSFIGSASVGWYLRSKLAPGTHCAMEHGGAAPVIVEPDADISEMIPALVKGGFYHAGQVCVSVQKVYVHESLCNEVTEKMGDMAKKLIVGDPLDPNTEVGPLIETEENDRLEEWINEALSEGAKLVCGGSKLSATCFEPTILLNPSENSKVSTMEIFGPVVCIYSYAERSQAIEKANTLPFCFQAAVFTRNIDIALDTAEKLNAMTVMINDHTAFRVDWMPFGGSDESGIGVGGIPYTMREMSREKLTVIKNNLLP